MKLVTNNDRCVVYLNRWVSKRLCTSRIRKYGRFLSYKHIPIAVLPQRITNRLHSWQHSQCQPHSTNIELRQRSRSARGLWNAIDEPS